MLTKFEINKIFMQMSLLSCRASRNQNDERLSTDSLDSDSSDLQQSHCPIRPSYEGSLLLSALTSPANKRHTYSSGMYAFANGKPETIKNVIIKWRYLSNNFKNKLVTMILTSNISLFFLMKKTRD